MVTIPIERLEKLEDKYCVKIHVNQYEDDRQDEYYVIIGGCFAFLAGHTIDELEMCLKGGHGELC